MPAYVRIAIAVMSSLLVHIALLIGLMGIIQQVTVHPPDVQGLMLVTLHPSLNKSSNQSRLPLAGTTVSATKKPSRAAPAIKPSSDVSKPIQTNAINGQISGHFRWRRPSTYQQSEVMNAMQLQQIAFQRKAQLAAVLQGLSTIAAQLGPIITAKFVCTQQAKDGIDCVPEPKDNERLLIVQFFNLAIQAQQLGMSENPVHMDFGATLGVSVTLRQNHFMNH